MNGARKKKHTKKVILILDKLSQKSEDREN